MDKLIDTLTGSGVPNPEPLSTISGISGLLINLFMGLGFGIGIMSIAYSAILYSHSEGDPKKTEVAWNAFILGIIAACVSIGVLSVKGAILQSIGVQTAEINSSTPGF